MTLTNKEIFGIVVSVFSIAGILLAFTLGIDVQKALGAEVTYQREAPADGYAFVNLLNATTTSATSTNLTGGGGYADITGAKEVTMYFSRAWDAGNAGSSRFRTQVTPNGTDWYDYDQLQIIDDVATSALYDARVGTSTITAATSTVMAKLDGGSFVGLRCIVVEATDGAHTCAAGVEY